MRRLIIADIHGNLPALEAVLKSAGRVDQIIFLGDLIDFGPNPAECIDLLIDLNVDGVIGNHDLGIIKIKDNLVNTDNGLIWAEWTCSQLKSRHFEYLNSLPVYRCLDIAGASAKLIHAITYEKYLSPSMKDSELNAFLEKHLEPIILCGHSHKLIDKRINAKRLISLLAVGQPKDGNNQAGYLIEKDGIFEHRRIEYNLKKLIYDIKKIGLPFSFEKRWIKFMEKGYDPEWCRREVVN